MSVNTDRWRAETFKDRADDEPAAIGTRTDELRELLASEDTQARVFTTHALVSVGRERSEDVLAVLDALADRFSDESASVRKNALAAVAAITSSAPDEIAPLSERVAQRLGDSSAGVRGNAALVCWRLVGDRPAAVLPAVEALNALLDADRPTVRRRAAKTLAALTDHDPARVRTAVAPARLADALREVETDESVVEQVLDRLNAVDRESRTTIGTVSSVAVSSGAGSAAAESDAGTPNAATDETGADTPVEPVTVERGAVGVRRHLDTTEFPVPAVVYLIRNTASDPVAVTVTDRVPDALDPSAVGFHPEYDDSDWRVEDRTVTYEREIGPGETVKTLYGLREGPLEADWDHQPTLQWDTADE